MNRKLILGLIILCIISITSVSAAEIDVNDTSDSLNSLEVQRLSVDNSSLLSDVDEEVPDEPDLVFNDTIYITSQNFDDYFDNNVLKSRCSGKTLIFSQNFENLGKIAIRANNVVLKGIGFTLKNTVFELDSKNITLTDLKMDLDSEFAGNDYAGILVYSVSNVTNTNVYPAKVPADDFAIVVITKTSGVATISFHFYDSFYINHYSYEHLTGWIKVGKTELTQVEFRNIPSGYSFDHVEDLSPYGITDSTHINVTLLTENSFIGDKPKIDFIYYVKYGNLYLHCKNNGSSTLASVKFNICII